MLTKELGVEAPYYTLDVPITCKRWGVEPRFVVDGEVGRPASPDPKLITKIVQAHDLFGQITEGKVAFVTEYARQLLGLIARNLQGLGANAGADCSRTGEHKQGQPREPRRVQYSLLGRPYLGRR